MIYCKSMPNSQKVAAIGYKGLEFCGYYGIEAKELRKYIDKLGLKAVSAVLGKPIQILTQGKDYLADSVRKYCRLPAGHPEGFYEAFANIYTAFTMALLKQKSGLGLTAQDKDFAGIDEGLSGVRFIDACVSSSQKNSGWIEY